MSVDTGQNAMALDAQLTDLMEQMNIPKSGRPAMLAMKSVQKKMMIDIHMRGLCWLADLKL